LSGNTTGSKPQRPHSRWRHASEQHPLHEQRGHKTGKRYLMNHAKDVTAKLMAELNDTLKRRKVFVYGHQGVEPPLQGDETTVEMNTGHWGAVDESNSWHQCDAALIFALHHKPDAQTQSQQTQSAPLAAEFNDDIPF